VLPPARAGRALVEHFIDRWESVDTFMALLDTLLGDRFGGRVDVQGAWPVAP
jgi:hypothetical protein